MRLRSSASGASLDGGAHQDPADTHDELAQLVQVGFPPASKALSMATDATLEPGQECRPPCRVDSRSKMKSCPRRLVQHLVQAGHQRSGVRTSGQTWQVSAWDLLLLNSLRPNSPQTPSSRAHACSHAHTYSTCVSHFDSQPPQNTFTFLCLKNKDGCCPCARPTSPGTWKTRRGCRNRRLPSPSRTQAPGASPSSSGGALQALVAVPRNVGQGADGRSCFCENKVRLYNLEQPGPAWRAQRCWDGFTLGLSLCPSTELSAFQS